MNYFKKPTALDTARVELEEAKRQFLSHSNSAAYHSKMSEYYSETVKRLSDYVKADSNE